MNKRFLIFITMIAAVLNMQAITVTTSAGQLATVVSDHSITSLTINGTIDARDFKFITDELVNLKTLDLSNVTINAYNSTLDDDMIAGEYQHQVRTLPYCALTGMITLQNLTLPANLKAIDYGALAGCTGLTAITIPSGVKRIGDDAFNYCSALTQVEIKGAVDFLGNSAFAHCHNLKKVVLNSYVPMVIGDNAFADCIKLDDVVINNFVTSIGDGAFNGCSALKSIYIQRESKIENIGDKAFYNSALESLNFDRMPLLKHLGAWALARTQLKKVSIPANVKSLDEGVLFYNDKLTTIELPKTLSYLPDYMLAGCEAINGTMFMTPNMGNIGDYAIYNQSQHSTINVPGNVYYIGSQAMAGMTGLDEITSEPLKVPELGDDVWLGIDQSRVKLNVNSESIEDYSAAEQWMNFLIGVAQLRGDINGDGFVNTADATAEWHFIINGDSQGIDTNRTDVNSDTDVNVGDIVSIYNIINGNVPFEKPHRPYLDDIIEGNGTAISAKTAKVDITINNTHNYTAFQFNITTPSNITITDVTLSERCLGHEIHFSKNGTNQYNLVAFSPANEDIEGYGGVIMTLSISSTKTITNNDKITLDDILFADNLENVYRRNNISINLLGVSAIDDITVDDSDRPVDVYNTQGQLLRQGVMPDQATQGLPAGIYIVGGKKILVR